MLCFSINKLEEGLRGRFRGEGIEREKREEEGKRENEVEALPNHDCDKFLHRSSFVI